MSANARLAKPASAPAAAAVKIPRSKSKEPKKSVDAATAADAAALSNGVDEPVKHTANTERSQSRNRRSIFGNLLGKKEEHAEKKEEKAEIKNEVKEEKKAEAEVKKEEAKETHEPSAAIEAAEASAVAAGKSFASSDQNFSLTPSSPSCRSERRQEGRKGRR